MLSASAHIKYTRCNISPRNVPGIVIYILPLGRIGEKIMRAITFTHIHTHDKRVTRSLSYS
jgi:hypothetical protein